MNDKVFLDANIVLDFFLKRSSYEKCVTLFELIQQRKVSAFVTSSIIQITAHWLTKAYGVENCKKLLISFLKEVKIIDCSHSIVERAIESKINDVEDAIQYFTATHHKLEYFISNDLKLLKQNSDVVKILSLDQFLQNHR